MIDGSWYPTSRCLEEAPALGAAASQSKNWSTRNIGAWQANDNGDFAEPRCRLAQPSTLRTISVQWPATGGWEMPCRWHTLASIAQGRALP